MKTVTQVVNEILAKHQGYLGNPPSETVRKELTAVLTGLTGGRPITTHESAELVMVMGSQIGALKMKRGFETLTPAGISELSKGFRSKASIILDSSLDIFKNAFYGSSNGRPVTFINDEEKLGQAFIEHSKAPIVGDKGAAKERLKEKIKHCLATVPLHFDQLKRLERWLTIWTFVDRGSDNRFGPPTDPKGGKITDRRAAITKALNNRIEEAGQKTPEALQKQVQLLKQEQEEKSTTPERIQVLKALQIRSHLKLFSAHSNSEDDTAFIGADLNAVGHGKTAAASSLAEARAIFESIKPPYSREVIHVFKEFTEAELRLLSQKTEVSNIPLLNAVQQMQAAEKAKDLLQQLPVDYKLSPPSSPLARTMSSMAAMRGDVLTKDEADHQAVIDKAVIAFNNAGHAPAITRLFTINDVHLFWDNDKQTTNIAGLVTILEGNLSKLSDKDSAELLKQPWFAEFLKSEEVLAVYDFETLLKRWNKLASKAETADLASQSNIINALLTKAVTPDQQARIPSGIVNIILTHPNITINPTHNTKLVDLAVRAFQDTKPEQVEERFNILRFLEKHDPTKAQPLWDAISPADIFNYLNQHHSTLNQDPTSAAFNDQLVLHAADRYGKLLQAGDSEQARKLVHLLHEKVMGRVSPESAAIIEYLAVCDEMRKGAEGRLLDRFTTFITVRDKAKPFANRLEQRFVPVQMSVDALVALLESVPVRYLQIENLVHRRDAISEAEANKIAEALKSALVAFKAGNPQISSDILGEHLKKYKGVFNQYDLSDNPIVKEALQSAVEKRYVALKAKIAQPEFELETANILIKEMELSEILRLLGDRDEAISNTAKQLLRVAVLLNPKVVEQLGAEELKNAILKEIVNVQTEEEWNALISQLKSNQSIVNNLKIWDAMPLSAAASRKKQLLAEAIATFSDDPTAFDSAVQKNLDLVLSWMKSLPENQVTTWVSTYLKTPDVAYSVFKGLEGNDALQKVVANHMSVLLSTRKFNSFNNLRQRYAIHEKLSGANKVAAAIGIANVISSSNISDLAANQWLEIMLTVLPLAQDPKQAHLLQKVTKNLSAFPQVLAQIYIVCAEDLRSSLVTCLLDDAIVFPIKQQELLKHILKSPGAIQALPIHRLKEVVEKLNGGLDATFLDPDIVAGKIINLRADLKARFDQANVLVKGMPEGDMLRCINRILEKHKGREVKYFDSLLRTPGDTSAPYIAAHILTKPNIISELSEDRIKILLDHAAKIPAEQMASWHNRIDYAAIAKKKMWVSGVSAAQLASVMKVEVDPDVRRALAAKIVICLEEDLEAGKATPEAVVELVVFYFREDLPFGKIEALLQKSELRQPVAEAILSELFAETDNSIARLLNDPKEAKAVLKWVFVNGSLDKLKTTFSKELLEQLNANQQKMLLQVLSNIKHSVLQERGEIAQVGRIVVAAVDHISPDEKFINETTEALRSLQKDVIAEVVVPEKEQKSLWQRFLAWLAGLFSDEPKTSSLAPEKTSYAQQLGAMKPSQSRARAEDPVAPATPVMDSVWQRALAVGLVKRILDPINQRIAILEGEAAAGEVFPEYEVIHQHKLSGLKDLRDRIMKNPRDLEEHITAVMKKYKYICFAGDFNDKDRVELQQSPESRTYAMFKELRKNFGREVALLPASPEEVRPVDEKEAKGAERPREMERDNLAANFNSCIAFLQAEVATCLDRIKEDRRFIAYHEKHERKGIMAAIENAFDDSVVVALRRSPKDKKVIRKHKELYEQKLKDAEEVLKELNGQLTSYSALVRNPEAVSPFIAMIEAHQKKIEAIEKRDDKIAVGDKIPYVATRAGAEEQLARHLKPLRDYVAGVSAASSAIPAAMRAGIEARASAPAADSSRGIGNH